MALSPPVPRQGSRLFSAFRRHLPFRVNAADFSPNPGT